MAEIADQDASFCLEICSMQNSRSQVLSAQGVVNQKRKLIHRLTQNAGVLFRVSVPKNKLEAIFTTERMNLQFVVRKARKEKRSSRVTHFITITETTAIPQVETLFRDEKTVMAAISGAAKNKFKFILSKDQLELFTRDEVIYFAIIRDQSTDSILVFRS